MPRFFDCRRMECNINESKANWIPVAIIFGMALVPLVLSIGLYYSDKLQSVDCDDQDIQRDLKEKFIAEISLFVISLMMLVCTAILAVRSARETFCIEKQSLPHLPESTPLLQAPTTDYRATQTNAEPIALNREAMSATTPLRRSHSVSILPMSADAKISSSEASSVTSPSYVPGQSY